MGPSQRSGDGLDPIRTQGSFFFQTNPSEQSTTQLGHSECPCVFSYSQFGHVAITFLYGIDATSPDFVDACGGNRSSFWDATRADW